MIVSAFARVTDARKTLTPQLRTDCGDTALLLLDLGAGKNRLGGSALAQVYGQIGSAAPDLDEPEKIIRWFELVQALNREGRILAYHDRSDGGIFVTLCEMAFASRAGLEITLGNHAADAVAALFNEELGAVLQVRREDLPALRDAFTSAGLGNDLVEIGTPVAGDRISVVSGGGRFSRRRARICTAHGRRRRSRCSGCATIRPARSRNTIASSMRMIRGYRPA